MTPPRVQRVPGWRLSRRWALTAFAAGARSASWMTEMSRAASHVAPPCGTNTGGSSQAITTRCKPAGGDQLRAGDRPRGTAQAGLERAVQGRLADVGRARAAQFDLRAGAAQCDLFSVVLWRRLAGVARCDRVAGHGHHDCANGERRIRHGHFLDRSMATLSQYRSASGSPGIRAALPSASAIGALPLINYSTVSWPGRTVIYWHAGDAEFPADLPW